MTAPGQHEGTRPAQPLGAGQSPGVAFLQRGLGSLSQAWGAALQKFL